MIPQYNFKLKFSVDTVINDNWQRPHPGMFFVKNYDERSDWEQILNDDFLETLDSIHPIVRVMVFNKPRSWTNQDAHIDPGILDALTITQSVKNSNAKMQWFNLINSANREVSYSDSNTPYVNYTIEELDLVHEDCIDNTVSIVRTDIPHRIAIGNNFRTCISFRFKKNFTCWEDMYCFYKNLNWVAD
jgi:hypothetical protein